MPVPHTPRVRPIAVAALLLVSGAGWTGAAAQSDGVRRGVQVASGTVAVREQTADQQVLQALNRLAFGPRPGDVARVRAMGVDAWIALQLDPGRIADPVIDSLIPHYGLLAADQGELARRYVAAARERRMLKRDSSAAKGAAADQSAFRAITRERAQLVGELASARVARAVASNRQLLEVMTDFWENHFNVYVRKNALEPYLLADYDRTIREHALGKFRDLLGAVAHSPAMLVYLDNALSRANPGEPTLAPAAPALERLLSRPGLSPEQRERVKRALAGRRTAGLNENYGRELLELHTLGVDGGYTQADVIAAARAFTGWSVRPPAQGGGFVFRPEWHDAGPKVFLGRTLPAGRGEADGEEVLDIVANSPATARFIARKLCERFVSDSPSTALVQRAAATFTRTGGDIREVVRTIVTSPEFFSAGAYRAKVKSPFETVVSAARALGAAPDTTPRTALAMAYLGQPLFGHQAPNGWPETGESWMNAGAILNRINFGLAVGAGRLPGASVTTLVGADSLRTAPRSVQVDAVVSALLGGAVSPDTRRILESGEHPLLAEHTLTGAPPEPAGDGRRGAGGALLRGGRGRGAMAAFLATPPNLGGLAQVVGLAIGSPEFQRR